jgi:hypothetical protein
VATGLSVEVLAHAADLGLVGAQGVLCSVETDGSWSSAFVVVKAPPSCAVVSS